MAMLPRPYLRRLVIAIYLAGIAASTIPLVGAVHEIRSVGDLMREAHELQKVSRDFDDLADRALTSASMLSARLIPLDHLERQRVLVDTDQTFDALALEAEGLSTWRQDLVDVATLKKIENAANAFVHTWREIRDDSDKALSDAERAFHFLKIFQESQVLAEALEEAERSADVRTAAKSAAVQERLERTILLLLAFLGVAVSGLTGTAVAHHGLLRKSDEAAAEIADKEASLRVQHDRFAAALTHMPQGLVMLDGELRVLVINDRYAEIYGLPPELRRPGISCDLLNEHRKGVIASIDGNSADSLVEDVHRSLLAGERARCEVLLKNGRIILITRERTAAGPWISIHEDITEMRAAEAERARALAEAEEMRRQEQAADAANRAKSTLLATMSHEIRTPMNALVGLSSTLLDSALDPEQRRAVEAIHDSSDNLLRLLNDVLDYAKLDSGKIELEALAFSPVMLVDNAVRIMRHRAEAKGLRLVVDTGDEVPAALRGDVGRLRQVLLNLLSNAIKFTDIGDIVVRVRCPARAGDRARLAFAVADRGIGIAPDRIAKLFTDFVQADSSISRRFGGTGLGLAISQRVLRQMGGSIRVESQLGKGSTFHVAVTLPLADAGELATRGAASGARALEAEIARLQRPLRVLLAEDNKTNQLVVSQMLKPFDVALTVVEDGSDALLAAPAGDFDLILMDVRMANMDGLQATAAIRLLGGSCRTVPIVALTANAFPQDVRDCFDAGMTDLLAKPVRKTALVEAMLRALRGAQRAVAPPLVPEPGESPAELVFDADTHGRLVAEIRADGAREALATFFAEGGQRIETLRGLPTSERRRIRTEAHTLKGAAGLLGFKALAQAAFSLEAAADAIDADAYPAAVEAITGAFAAARAALAAAPAA